MTYLLTLHPVFLAGATGFLSAVATLALLAALRARRSDRNVPRGRLQFEGRALVASDGPARSAFDGTQPVGDDWSRAVALLEPDVPTLDARRPPSALSEGLLR